MKKVLLITQEFPPAVGGAGSVAENTARLIARHHRVTVLTAGVRGRRKYDFDVVEARYIKKLFVLSLYVKFRNIYAADTDIILLNDIGSAMMAAYFFPPTLMEKCVVYLHGSEPERIFLRPSLLMRLTRFKKRYVRLLARSAKIVAVSQYMKQKFLSCTKLRELEDKIAVVYNGVDFARFRSTPGDIRRRYGIAADKKLLLSAGSVKKEKGYVNQYRIFKQLVQSGGNYHWIITGSGPLASVLLRMGQADGLAAHITFAGRVERDTLPAFYSAADVFWQLSNCDEALGLVYIEALACGTPVIGRNRAGVKEIIKTGRNGFLPDSDDACYRILSRDEWTAIDRAGLLASVARFDNQNIYPVIEKEVLHAR